MHVLSATWTSVCRRPTTDFPALIMSTMQCRHLLIKFSGSRNPVSRRTNHSTANVTAEAATAELKQYADKINAEGCTEAGVCRSGAPCTHARAAAPLCGPSGSPTDRAAVPRVDAPRAAGREDECCRAPSQCLPSTARSAATAARTSRAATSASLVPAICSRSSRRAAGALTSSPQRVSTPLRDALGGGPHSLNLRSLSRATAVGKMSDIVLSDSGYHMIFRTK